MTYDQMPQRKIRNLAERFTGISCRVVKKRPTEKSKTSKARHLASETIGTE